MINSIEVSSSSLGLEDLLEFSVKFHAIMSFMCGCLEAVMGVGEFAACSEFGGPIRCSVLVVGGSVKKERGSSENFGYFIVLHFLT